MRNMMKGGVSLLPRKIFPSQKKSQIYSTIENEGDDYGSHPRPVLKKS